MKRSICVLLALLIVVSTTLSACGATPQPTKAPEPTKVAEATQAPAPTTAPPTAAPQPTTPPKERGTLRTFHHMAWGGKESIDPASSVRLETAVQMVYSKLVRRDKKGLPEPELALSWTPNETAQIWTFKLRPGVKFHNGKPFTSADVLYTFKHILDPKLESPAASTYKLVDLATTQAPDDLTVIFHLTAPHADFPLILTDYRASIIPQGDADAAGQATGIGTGPFKMEKWDVLGTTVMVANDDYWEGPPGLAKVTLVPIADIEARVQALQADQIDFVQDLTPTHIKLFEGKSKFAIQDFPSGFWQGFVMMTTQAPFDNVKVRTAFKLAVDRQEMIDVVLEGHGSIACDTPVWPGDPYQLKRECPQDIEGAKKLLAEAGVANGITAELYVSDIDAYMIPMAVVYKEQAAKAGITIDIKQVPADGFWTKYWLIVPFVGTHWRQLPADQILNEGFRCGGAWNESFWCNDQYVNLLDGGRKELDLAKRTKMYQDAQQLLVDESGDIIPFFVNEIRIMNARVRGVEEVQWNDIRWNKVYIQEP